MSHPSSPNQRIKMRLRKLNDVQNGDNDDKKQRPQRQCPCIDRVVRHIKKNSLKYVGMIGGTFAYQYFYPNSLFNARYQRELEAMAETSIQFTVRLYYDGRHAYNMAYEMPLTTTINELREDLATKLGKQILTGSVGVFKDKGGNDVDDATTLSELGIGSSRDNSIDFHPRNKRDKAREEAERQKGAEQRDKARKEKERQENKIRRQEEERRQQEARKEAERQRKLRKEPPPQQHPHQPQNQQPPQEPQSQHQSSPRHQSGQHQPGQHQSGQHQSGQHQSGQQSPPQSPSSQAILPVCGIALLVSLLVFIFLC